MEMMDLPTYLDSFRESYDRALEELSDRIQTMSDVVTGAVTDPVSALSTAYAPPEWSRRTGPHRRRRGHDPDCRHHHDCDHDHDDCRDHDCGDWDHDCRCECCIVDADIVVYARCGELRVIPIAIDNDTRKAREDVTLEVSEVRSAGGRVLPWRTLLRPEGPVSIEACSTLEAELFVHVSCGDRTDEKPSRGQQSNERQSGTSTEESGDMLQAMSEQRQTFGDVDRCEVGYVTIRVGGCLVRPTVVAIAVLPSACDRYHAACQSCC